jgi:hypothetical protein
LILVHFWRTVKMPFWLYKNIRMCVIELISSWIELIIHISCSSLVDILHEHYRKNTIWKYFFFCFMGCISLSHCMLISVAGYRPCNYTKCEKWIHCSLPPFFEFCLKLTIEMIQQIGMLFSLTTMNSSNLRTHRSLTTLAKH